MMNANIFGGGIFGQKTSDPMEEMRRQIEFNQMQYNKMQQAQQQQTGANGLLDQLKTTLSALSQDEQKYLMNIPEFTQAKAIYESGFMDFLGGKYAAEYINTPVGKQSVENLNDVAKHAVKQIKDSARERTEKLEAMAKLLESDPEIQKKLQEQLSNK